MKNAKMGKAQNSLNSLDSYKPFSSSAALGPQYLAFASDPDFQEWIYQNTLTEDDLQYLKTAIWKRMLIWFLPCLCIPLLGAFFFVTEWSYYKIVKQRTFTPRLGFWFVILNLGPLLLRLGLYLVPLVMIGLVAVPVMKGDPIPLSDIMALVPALILGFLLLLYADNGFGTAFRSTCKKGFVGLGDASLALREEWERICRPARIIRWVVVGIFAAAFVAIDLIGASKIPSGDLVVAAIGFDLIALAICSVINNIRYRLLLKKYASGEKTSRVEKTSVPRERKPARTAASPAPTKSRQPSGKKRGGAAAGAVAAVVAVLLGLAFFVLPRSAVTFAGGSSRNKDEQTAKQPSSAVVQGFDYSIYEGTFVPVVSYMETGGPRVELRMKGQYLFYDIFYDVMDSERKADISGAAPVDGRPEIFLSKWDNTFSGKIYLLEGRTIAVETSTDVSNSSGQAMDIPYTELVALSDDFHLENIEIREPDVWEADIQGPDIQEPDAWEPVWDETTTDPSEYYLWPTDTQYITYDDLSPLSQHEIMLIRNELYARYGCSFQNEAIRNYFLEQVWYAPNPDLLAINFSVEWFTEIERTNLETILSYENAMGWKQ